MRFYRAVIVILSATIMMTSLSVSVFAATDSPLNGISPFYVIPHTVRSSLSITDKSASCNSYAYEPEATNITVEQTLEYRQGSNWYPVNNASWITSTHSATINYSNSKSDLSSGTYRVKSVFTFTNSKGETETVTEYSSEKTC